jgi:hypothetical protein
VANDVRTRALISSCWPVSADDAGGSEDFMARSYLT